MDEQVNELAQGTAPEPKPNRGRFQPGDRRINREGRPIGRKSAVRDSHPADCARCADRVKLLFVRGRELAYRLGHRDAPWAVNLPGDAQVVDGRFDHAREGLVLIVRSAEFPRIARGTPIPELIPHYDGLKWGRHWGPDGDYTREYVGVAVVLRPKAVEQSRAE
jgi:hypothetical protein